MERATQETWAKRIERWKESGLTAGEFASEVGVNVHSLRWWQWRLGAGAKKRMRVQRSTPAKGAASTASPFTFIEVAAGVRGDPLEVVLATGIAIRVRPAFDAATLTRLLDVLEGRR